MIEGDGERTILQRRAPEPDDATVRVDRSARDDDDTVIVVRQGVGSEHGHREPIDDATVQVNRTTPARTLDVEATILQRDSDQFVTRAQARAARASAGAQSQVVDASAVDRVATSPDLTERTTAPPRAIPTAAVSSDAPVAVASHTRTVDYARTMRVARARSRRQLAWIIGSSVGLVVASAVALVLLVPGLFA